MDPQHRKSARIKNRRRGGRVALESVMCDLGTVIDLSPSGICIVTRKRLKGRLQLKIFYCGGTLVVECEVVRSHRCGIFKKEIGLRFIDPLPHIAATLTEIARTHGRQGLAA